MNSLDFLSEPPKYFIFQKGTNKTNLGGVLFLIYILIFLSISFVYIYDYYTSDKYIIESSLIVNPVLKKDFEEWLDDNKNNPEINFSIELYDHFHQRNLSDNFIIRDWKTGEKIDRGVFFKRKAYDFGFYIQYKCENKNCTIKEEDNTLLNFLAEIKYQSFNLDHQSEDSPIKTDQPYIFVVTCPFFFKNVLKRTIRWENIRYKEEVGVFTKLFSKKENVYYYGKISSNSDVFMLDDTLLGGVKNETIKTIGIINIGIEAGSYLEYKRKKVSRLDILANIGALSSTIYSIFVKIFGLIYSKNFNNYKIIEKILSKKLKINYNENKNKKEIELSNDYKNLMDDKLSKENNLIINDIDIDNNNNYNLNNNKELNSTLPKLRFFDFFFNNIYNYRCCCKLNKQELLSICNEILYRYISIDYILYNQIKLENLFKDYKWNNPKLNDIENNDLIIELKNYI